ncbi:hypothetical protein ABIB27_000981 [Arthrobacter sp. UYEF21]
MSPNVTSSWDATTAPTPLTSKSSGAWVETMTDSSASISAISSLRNRCRAPGRFHLKRVATAGSAGSPAGRLMATAFTRASLAMPRYLALSCSGAEVRAPLYLVSKAVRALTALVRAVRMTRRA